MTFLETVRHWNEGVVAFQDGRFQDALDSFNRIQDPSARIQFNIACVLQRLDREDDCIAHLTEALKKDPHLAVGYYHRSVQLIKTGMYDKALDDLDRAEQSLRGAAFINYSQLGLHFTLYKFEMQFNRAVCYAKKGDIRTAIHMLIEAGKVAEEEVHSRISVSTIQDLTLFRQDGSKCSLPDSLKACEIPSECIFQPPKDMVANLEKKQFVAKSKVICRYGQRKTPRTNTVITGSVDSTLNKDAESKPSFSAIAPRTPPLPRRPLPPPPTEMRSSKSAGDLVAEIKKDEISSNNRKFSIDIELTKVLNDRFKNELKIDTSSTTPEKPPRTPLRPPKRPPPPSTIKSTETQDVYLTVGPDLDTPSLPAKIPPSRNVPPPPAKSTTIGTTRNIPAPPSYKPPPPPPNFKPPSPPTLHKQNLPPVPPKNKLRSNINT